MMAAVDVSAGEAPPSAEAKLEKIKADGAVDPGLAELLLDDCAGATPLQLRHELRLLRELLAAERGKLRAHQQAAGEIEPAGPTGGKPKGATAYTAVVDTSGSYSGGGMMYVAKQSLIEPRRANLAERKTMAAQAKQAGK